MIDESAQDDRSADEDAVGPGQRFSALPDRIAREDHVESVETGTVFPGDPLPPVDLRVVG